VGGRRTLKQHLPDASLSPRMNPWITTLDSLSVISYVLRITTHTESHVHRQNLTVPLQNFETDFD
jgi:hypothetical protein